MCAISFRFQFSSVVYLPASDVRESGEKRIMLLDIIFSLLLKRGILFSFYTAPSETLFFLLILKVAVPKNFYDIEFEFYKII